MPLVDDFMSFGRQLDPQSGSYYSNLTGFWRGEMTFHNLTNETSQMYAHAPFWLKDASDFVSAANLTNATELSERLGKWRWAQSGKVAISFGDKMLWADDDKRRHLSKDIALVHVRGRERVGEFYRMLTRLAGKDRPCRSRYVR